MRQTNFSGGEIAPKCWARNDRPFFGKGLRTMRNFFATRDDGAAVSRPGSLFINKTRDDNGTARLLPFVYSDDSSFCIEMGMLFVGAWHVYFRFYTLGVQLQAKYLPLTAVGTMFQLGEVVTGATTGAFGTVLGIGYMPDGSYRLQLGSITGNFNYLELLTGSRGGAATANDTQEDGAFEVVTGTVDSSFDLNQVRFAQTGAVMTLTHPSWGTPQELRRYENAGGQPKWTFSTTLFRPPFPYFDPASTAGGYPVLLSPLPAADATHPARPWTYVTTLLVQETATGRIIETGTWVIAEQWDGSAAAPVTISTPSDLVVYPDLPITIKRGTHLEVDGLGTLVTEPTQNFNFPNTDYRVISMQVYRGRGGLFGWVGSSDSDTFVDVGAEPDFSVQPPLGSNPFRIVDHAGTVVEDGPRAVAFFEDRRVFAGTLLRPTSVIPSATGKYTDFDQHSIIHVAGESLYYELAARKFEEIVHVVSHERLIIGTKSSVWRFSGAQGALDFDSVDAKVVQEVGMADIAPLMAGDLVIFARRKGNGVLGMKWDGSSFTYAGVDLFGHANHLFVGRSIGAAGAATKKKIVDWTYAEDPFGIVWAVREDGMLLSGTFIGSEYGWARHDGEPTTLSETAGNGTPAAYKRICAVPEEDEDAVYAIVQRSIAGSFGTHCIERFTSRVEQGTEYDHGCVDCGVMYSGAPALAITGLGHLEGETVYVIGVDNPALGPFTVTGGQVVLEELPTVNSGLFNVVLYVGLLYVCDLELLDAVSESTKLKKKAVTRVGWEVDHTTGIEVGEDFDSLLETRPNTVEDGYDAPVPETQELTVIPNRTWNTNGRAVLRQTKPLPVTVVGVTREFEIGG